jgi:hypothetical protein
MSALQYGSERVWPLPPVGDDARREEAHRVVDESFNFIDNELRPTVVENVNGGGSESASGRLQRLIHRNSSGQIDAVYERRIAAAAAASRG